ncbi:hypothetical protein LG634_01600 [Streptomyces bambusae]|uniref:hypothetical protein n=1 Tax=Streptomyces bambusae TaxID=1550616 RepID=UPI001CFCACE0|nr:hypothetical protein [Streptomyces bambusae]MCB5163544.1 hypothetical protein [Streptomyces bambusae]
MTRNRPEPRTRPRSAALRRRPAAPAGGTVRARFSLSELPVLTVHPASAAPAAAAAVRTLATAGRGYLGGHLELRTSAPAGRSAALTAATRRATALAVASALRGGPGTARVRIGPHTP